MADFDTAPAATEQHAIELQRIRDAYDRRAAAGLDARYSYGDPGNLFIVQSRERVFLRQLARAGLLPLAGRDILEVGCGTGFWLRQFIQWGASPERLTGIELLPDRAELARERCPASTRIIDGDAANAMLPSAAFDIVFQSTVFTSILDGSARQALAAEMRRLVKPGGTILSYDFRYDNPRNPDVSRLTVTDLRRLFVDCRITTQPLTLAPFVARRVARVSRLACEALNTIPFLRTHVLAIIQPHP